MRCYCISFSLLASGVMFASSKSIDHGLQPTVGAKAVSTHTEDAGKAATDGRRTEMHQGICATFACLLCLLCSTSSCRQWDKHQHQQQRTCIDLIYLSLSTAFHYTEYTCTVFSGTRHRERERQCRCCWCTVFLEERAAASSHSGSSSQLILCRLRLTHSLTRPTQSWQV